MDSHNKNSVWVKGPETVSFPKLKENKSTDVLIIGGGIAGVLCAYKLQKEGIDCMLVEADKIGLGITKNTTAKITVAHGLLYDKMLKRFGYEKTRIYAEAQINAFNEFYELCKNIDCDYEKKDSYVYSLNGAKKIEKELIALDKIGVKADFTDVSELPFSVDGAVRIKDQAQFHPLKFLYVIARGLPIYERTKVTEIMPQKVIAGGFEVGYKKLIIATHFPIINKHGLYPLKLYQHRSYVLALRGTDEISGMYVDESDTGLSFRTYGELLLLGGGAHRTGKKGGCWQELEKFTEKHYKNAQIVAKWATQDCMTLDGIPYVGQYARVTPDVFVVTGFNKWGMTNSMAAANILCDLLKEKENAATNVFSPMRNILRPQLAVNTFESILGLITPTAPRCPHLGCALKYNKAEHSWDCPCHGSRFTESGELIDNPATDGKTDIK